MTGKISEDTAASDITTGDLAGIQGGANKRFPTTLFQPSDATLTSLSALGTAADKLAYTTGVDIWAETALTAFARSILDDTDEATFKATVNLEIGTDVQAWDSLLDSISAVAQTANTYMYFGGGGVLSTDSITTFGRSLIDDSNASTARTTLGGGTAGSERFTRASYDTAVYVASRTALKALDTTKETVAVLTESGREGIFTVMAGSSPYTDTSEILYVTSDTAGYYWVRQRDDIVILASWTGAATDGSTDDAAAHQAAIDLLESMGGGIYRLMPGVSSIGSTLTIDDHNVHVVGLGSTVNTNNSNWRQYAASTIKWNGATGGTMFQLKTPTANTERLQNCDISHVLLDCVKANGTDEAAIAVEILTMTGGHFQNCNVLRPSSTGWNIDIGTGLTSLTDPDDVQHVVWTNCHVWAITPTPGGSGAGWTMGGTNVTTGTGNVSLCQWHNCAAYVYDGTGWEFYGSDSNTAVAPRVYVHASGSGYHTRFHGGSAANEQARSNTILHPTGSGDIIAVSGTVQADNNTVFGYSTENGSAAPAGTARYPIYSVGDNGKFVFGSGEIWTDDSGAGSTEGLALTRYSASPAANDALNELNFNGFDSGGAKTTYAQLVGLITDPTDASEDGGFYIRTMAAGSLGIRAWWRQGLAIGSGTADPGSGSINVSGKYETNGTTKIDSSGGLCNQTDSAANIASATATVNTTNKTIGKQVWDLTNGRLMIAMGTSSTSNWKSMVDGALVTPS